MKKHHKISLSIILIITLLFTGSFAAIAAPVSSSDDYMTINKTAKAVDGQPRTFEVELTVIGTLPNPKPLDVVIVIDRSSSMNNYIDSNHNGRKDSNEYSSLDYAKQAAKSFAQQILNANSQNRIAVYDFNGPSLLGSYGNVDSNTRIRTTWWTLLRWSCKGFTNSISTVNSAIDGITASGGTNIQAGFLRAKKIIEGNEREYGVTWYQARPSSEADRVVVLLTDGVATSSERAGAGPNEPTRHNSHTEAAYEAGQSLHSLAKVFTIGLFSTISNQQVRSVAEDTLQRAQNAGCYITNAAPDLTGIYDQIYQNINYYAANAIITDVIDNRFELVPESIVTKIGTQVVTTPAATYNPSTRTITWSPGNLDTSATLTYRVQAKDTTFGDNIPTNDYAKINYTNVAGTPNQTLTFPVPKVNVPGLISITANNKTIVIGDPVNLGEQVTVTGGTTPYTFEWTWGGGSSNNENLTVSPRNDTQYSVTVTDNNGYSASTSFMVYVKKGTVIIQKEVDNVDNDPKVFSIHMNKVGSNSVWNVLARDGESYTITNLGPGTYTISETVPMNYELVGITEGTISFNSDDILNGESTRYVTVTNKKIKVPYFWDTASVQNVFKAGSDFSQ